MPLAFSSLSHGTIAFGFFNIESHMLLLEDYFFFADEFCSNVSKLAQNPAGTEIQQNWPIFHFEDRTAIGDLMGAIQGARFTGFLGDVYRRFPFPSAVEEFKQNPGEDRTRETMIAMIEKYGRRREMVFPADLSRKRITLGNYHFDRDRFQALVRYVWQGGYPRWRDNAPPDYVRAMKSAVDRGAGAFFETMHWD